MYAHCISEASWAGARIIQGQWTEQAQSLYDLIILVFSENGGLADLEALKKRSGVGDEEWEDLLQYSSQVQGQSCRLPFRPNARIRF
jgi:dipeptidyl-peptidase-3